MLPLELAERLERRELIAATFYYQFRSGSHEENEALLHFFRLGSNTYLSLTFCAEDDAWSCDGFESCFCPRLLQICFHDAELLDRWIIQSRRGARRVCSAVERNIGIMRGVHLLL
jgi:hypothetical protein